MPRIRITVSRKGHRADIREFSQSCITIGRHPTNDAIVADPVVSNHHGEIRITSEGLIYRDLGSTNGSVVRRDGVLLALGAERGRSVALEDEDEILFGNSSSSIAARVKLISTAAAEPDRAEDSAETLDIAKSLRAAEPAHLSMLSEGLERDALLVVHRFTQQATGMLDVDRLLDHFGASVLEALPAADHLTVYLLEPGSGDYPPVFSRDRQGHVEAEPLSRALRQLVVDRGRAVQFSVTDPELDGSESMANTEITAGLCAPMYHGEQLIGVALVDSRVKAPALTIEGLEVFTILSHQLALCIANARLTEGLEATVAELTRARTEMEQLAFFDPLTGLPNRRLYLDRLGQALRMCLRQQQQIAVLYLDVDNFKPINDTLGHDAGDEVLCILAERMRACVRDQDTVARFGGDEFAMLLYQISGIEAARIVVEKILAAIRQPLVIVGRPLNATVSIGVALAPQHGTRAETLLKNADAALYRAKKEGRNESRFFGDELIDK